MPEQQKLFDLTPASPVLFRLAATLDYADGFIRLEWFGEDAKDPHATLRIRCTGLDALTWEFAQGMIAEQDESSLHRSAIRARLARLTKRFPVAEDGFTAQSRGYDNGKRAKLERLELPAGYDKWVWLEGQIVVMARDSRIRFGPLGRVIQEIKRENPSALAAMEAAARHEQKKREKLAAELARRREMQQRLRDEQRKREIARGRTGREQPPGAREQASREKSQPETAPTRSRLPVPGVPLSVELPAIEFQQEFLSLSDLKNYFLRERAARWWISNQSDDLLCLPYCHIQRLEYQIRSALRVLGPLRGRALLSDEVGLGKTIEAGLVLKEYLTRGMAKRALILTVPSLVDQWEEELTDKFNLASATTNQPSFRSDPVAFWRDHNLIVASLHTLKQPAHIAVAQTVNWDLLVVDEAHYLRNRDSLAWQAVNALPRQFLLLLTATPVQNSLEELYNLVTLLKPGQLPSPKEFRARFIDRNKPHQPRQPEELRRLLGQVMIRNTRANAGIQLPPRRAETVLFEPEGTEREFWQTWETELREQLAQFNAGQASLWGRLLLQAAGSSPNAWRGTLEKFPARAVANGWAGRAPLEASWRSKCELMLPLTRDEGGVVIFSQFLQTQAALAAHLVERKVPTFVINGQTPPTERQPISDAFRKEGGALLLTHSGTEGRNLQFCHRLVNFDLPWNPMEVEQRIGRLHRIGQQHPVCIFNLVQAGTLQEHLLQILQEKLNLFELVVGETGLILGDRFSSDEFAEEVFRRWRESEGRVAEALQNLGDELAAARGDYEQVKQLDETLFAKDYEL